MAPIAEIRENSATDKMMMTSNGSNSSAEKSK